MTTDSPLSDAQAQRLIKMYGAAEAEILKECNRLLLKNPESYSLAWQKTVLRDLLTGSRTWTGEAIQDSYMKGVAWADADPLSGNKLLADFGSIHQQAVEVLADNAYSRLENVVHVIGRQTDDLFRSVALEHAKGSVIGYQTTKQVAKRIREDLAERGITGFVDKAGHEWDMRRYAKVLSQETTNQSFRQGTINRLQEKGHDLVRLSTHSGSCKRCIPFQGQTFSLAGTDKEFPSLDEARAGGVFHVGCLHVVSLAPEELDRFLGKLQGKEGEAARQAEIDRLAAKWDARNKGKSSPDLAEIKQKLDSYRPKEPAAKKPSEAPKQGPSTAPTQPVQIQTKAGGAKAESIPRRAERLGGKNPIEDTTPDKFIKHKDELPKDLRNFLTPYTADEYKAGNVKLKLHESGGGGYGLKGDELISVFSKPGKHLGSELVDDAIANGAKRLDCLGDSLLKFYSDKGFKVVKTDKWDDKYAPKDWDYEKFKRPNLYYMELK